MLNLISILVFLIASNAPGILPVERQFATSPVECASGWNISGEPVFSFCGGDQREVVLTVAQRQAIVGGVLTHNHPADGCWTLSQFDLDLAAMLHLRQMRAVSKQGDRVRVAVFGGAVAIPFTAIAAEARQQVPKFQDNPDGCAYLDAAWRVLARRYGFTYFVLTE